MRGAWWLWWWVLGRWAGQGWAAIHWYNRMEEADLMNHQSEWASWPFAKYKIFAGHRFASRNLYSSPVGKAFDFFDEPSNGTKEASAQLTVGKRLISPNSVPKGDRLDDVEPDFFWRNLGLNSQELDPRGDDVWASYSGIRAGPAPDRTEVPIPSALTKEAQEAEYSYKDKAHVALRKLDAVRRVQAEAFAAFQNGRALAKTSIHAQCWNTSWPASLYLPDVHVISLLHPWNQPFSVPCHSCTPPSSRPGLPSVFWAFKHQQRLTAPFLGRARWLQGLGPTVPENDLIHSVARLNFRWAVEAPYRMQGPYEDFAGGDDATLTRMGDDPKWTQRSQGGRAFYFAQRIRQQPVSGTASSGFHFLEPDGRLAVDPNPGSGVTTDTISPVAPSGSGAQREESFLEWNSLSLLCMQTQADGTETPTNTLVNVDSLVRPEWVKAYDRWVDNGASRARGYYPQNTFWALEQHEAAGKAAACDDAGGLARFNLRLGTHWEPWGCCSACCCKSGPPHYECDRGPGRCARLRSHQRRRGLCSLHKLRPDHPIILDPKLKLLSLPPVKLKVPRKDKPMDPLDSTSYTVETCDAWCQWKTLDAWLSTPPYRATGIPWFSTLLQNQKLGSVVEYFRRFLPAVKDAEEGRGLGLYVESRSCGGKAEKKNCTLWAACRERERTGLSPIYPLSSVGAYQARQRALETALEAELAEYVYDLEDEMDVVPDPMDAVDLTDPAQVAQARFQRDEAKEDLQGFTNFSFPQGQDSLELSVEPGTSIRVQFSGLSKDTMRDLSRIAWAQHVYKIPVGGTELKAGKRVSRRVFAERRRAGESRVDGLWLRLKDVQAIDTSHPIQAAAEMARAEGGVDELATRYLSLSLKRRPEGWSRMAVVLGVSGGLALALLGAGLAGRAVVGRKRRAKDKARKARAKAQGKEETFGGGQKLIRVRRNRNWKKLVLAGEEDEDAGLKTAPSDLPDF